ncbi:MAG: winged helix DNA-binding domain-containing protein [Ilumatobacteraceae bacterium]
MRPKVTTAQRRARLAVRHRLVASEHTDDIAAIADSLVALHSSDPVTVYLSAVARMVHPSLDAVATSLYDEHTVVRHHAMRRTLWVMTPGVTALAHAACTTGLVKPEWNRIARLLESSEITDDGDAWLTAAKRDTLAALHRLGAASTRRIGAEVPELTKPLRMAAGTSYAATPAAHTRVMILLGFDGAIVRGRPSGTWINGQYTWLPMDAIVPGGLPAIDPAVARADLVRRWLFAFGPATTTDIQWWLGSTLGAVRHALAAVDAVEVSLDQPGGGTGWMLADDLDPVDTPGPFVAVLPGLDPTTMGWKERSWYLGEHGAHVFDRNGNGGPTIWVDGEIVGSWVQRKDGTLARRLLQDVPAQRVKEIDRHLAALRDLLGDTRHTVRFPAPIQRDLLA